MLITDDMALISNIHSVFNSSMPVADRNGLWGRGAELKRLVASVLYQGRHGIIYGARGSGKTSLSRVFGDFADEHGNLVLYHSASGDSDFAGLMHPVAVELASFGGSAAQRSLTPPPLQSMDARNFGGWLIDHFDRPILIVLDEFDRIASQQTKADISSLMKFLSDIRAPIRLVLVGIASDIDHLISGHPSLRRHLESLYIGPIAKEELIALLDRCCQQVDMTIDADVADYIATAASGSPYHLRLFGLHAALSAAGEQRRQIEMRDAEAGFREALGEWERISRDSSETLRALIPASPQAREAMCVAAILDCYVPLFDALTLRSALMDYGFEPAGIDDRVEQTIRALQPALIQPSPGSYSFSDTLAPQFFVLMLRRGGDARRVGIEQRDQLGSAMTMLKEGFR
ncbi:AAA family ATPase [Sphingomonas spermidinifaciens]|nr:AAA family ATPase [Sphingomonas spermidinifaciens]